MSDADNFNKSAVNLAQSPLGIIALFIILVYGISSLFLALGSSLDPNDRHVIVYFMVVFPVFVMCIFSYLVSCHYTKLFGPGNFKNEDNFVKMLNAAVSLTAAAGKDADSISAGELKKIVATVETAARSPVGIKERKRRILWVDDRPENNVYERQAFEAIGIEFTLALSTNEALEVLSRRDFAAIISDMGRKEGPREGYVLLDRIRSEQNRTPLFFFASSNAPQHKKETAEHQGQGCTNNGQELFEMVVKELMRA